jgi:hypothetical protein
MKKKEARKPRVGVKSARELVPSSLGKLPRDPALTPAPDTSDIKRTLDFYPSPICPIWPGNEVAQTHDFGLSSDPQFLDNFDYHFPPSFYSFCRKEKLQWRWPEEIIPMNEVHSRFSRRYVMLHNTSRAPNTSGLGNSINNLPAELQDISIEEMEKIMAVVTFFEREETAEEFEARKVHEIERQATLKKAKGKVEEPMPGKVREVKLGNIEMGRPMPSICKWISSQMQVIKDRGWKDPTTGEPIWKRIYPQKDGIPVYNPSGKYWIKMLLYGTERLVEIDSRVPINFEGQLLLPRSSAIRDIWPILLSKAYFKLYAFRWVNVNPYIHTLDEEIDGSFIYSITGLMPQRYHLDQIKDDEWRYLSELLSDECWKNTRAIVSIYCSNDKKPYIPSMTSKSSETSDLMTRGRESVGSPELTNHILEDFSVEKRTITPNQESPLRRASKIRTMPQLLRDVAGQAVTVATGRNFSFMERVRPCYVITGFGYLLFENFTNPIDFDMKKVQRKEKVKMEEEAKTAILKAKATSPARKLKKHQSPARLREFQKRKQKREKEKEEKRQKLLEVRTYPTLKLFKLKTAVTNVPVLNIVSPFQASEIEEAKLRILNREYFLHRDLEILEKQMEEEDKELFDPRESLLIEEFKKEEEKLPESLNYPLKRVSGGVWVTAEDIPYAFDEIIIYHQPFYYKYKLLLDDLWKDVNNLYRHNENFDVWIVENSAESSENIEILVGYSPYLPKNMQYSPHHISFSLKRYDFANEAEVTWQDEVKISTHSISSSKYVLPTDEYVLRPFINCAPCGSMTWVYSTHPVVTMSRSQYLTQKLGWQSQIFNIEYPAQSAGSLFTIFKYDIKSIQEEEIRMKISFSDPTLEKYCELAWIDREQSSQETDQQVLIDIPSLQRRILAIKASERGHRFVMSGIPKEILPEGTITVEVLSPNLANIQISPMELLDPIEYIDRYNPNKYGTIFREQIFITDENPISIHVKIRKIAASLQAVKGKEAQPLDMRLPLYERLILLELYEGDSIIFSAEGYNQARITHINLKNSGKEFLLVCKYDLNEFPECIHKNEETEDLSWILKITSPDTVAVVKDTRKEDREEAIRKTWETNQPGRSELAKYSRARYLAMMKRDRGEELTEQEAELVKENWEERRKAKKDAAEMLNKGKAKKDDKKTLVKEDKHEDDKLVVPSPYDHIMAPVKEFLEHLHSNRLITNDGEQKVLSLDEIEEFESRVSNEVEEFNKYMEDVNSQKTHQKQDRDTLREEFKNSHMKFRHDCESILNKYKEDREHYKTKLEKRKEVAAKLTAAMQGVDLKVFEEAYEEGRALGCDVTLLGNASKQLRKLRISKYSDQLKKVIQESDFKGMIDLIETLDRFDIKHELDPKLVFKAESIHSKFTQLNKLIQYPRKFNSYDIQQMISESSSIPYFESLVSEAAKVLTSVKSCEAEETLREKMSYGTYEEIQQLIMSIEQEGLEVDPDLITDAKALLEVQS